MGGPAADPEGSCLRSPVLLVHQGAAGLTTAREGPDPGSAQVGRVGRAGKQEARPLLRGQSPPLSLLFSALAPSPAPIETPGARHAPPRRGPRHRGNWGSCFRCAICWSGLSGPPFPAPTSGGPPGPRSSACWLGPQEDRRRSWHFSEPGTVSPPAQMVEFSMLS